MYLLINRSKNKCFSQIEPVYIQHTAWVVGTSFSAPARPSAFSADRAHFHRGTRVMIHLGPALNPTGPGLSRIRPVSR